MSKRTIIWILAIVAAGAAVLGLITPASAVRKNIGNEELVQLQNAGALVVDVRTTAEYSTGHIPNSVNVPLDQLQQAAAGWNKSEPIVVYCATGARSANAAAYLSAQGFRKVYNLEKGIAAWTGQTVGGGQTASLPSGPGAVKTDGKPVFIDFASST